MDLQVIYEQNKTIIKQNKMLISLLSDKGIKAAKPVNKAKEKSLAQARKNILGQQ